MTAPEGNSNDHLMETIHDLTRRLEIQETLVREQGAELKRLQSGGAASRSVVGGNASRPHRLSRKGLFTVAATGVVAAAVSGFDPSLSGGTAQASDNDAVRAGDETKAEHGTVITYNGSPGLTGGVLIGNDSTYGAGPYNYPAAVAGLAGGGSSAGVGKVPNGIYGFTDNGAGNGVVGFNSNKADGSGSGVLGLAFREFSYGVQGVNTRGDGVYGVSISCSGPVSMG